MAFLTTLTLSLIFVTADTACFCSDKSGRPFVTKRTSKTFVWPVYILVCVASSGCEHEKPEVVISLNEIWARSMPGTQSIEDLEPKHFGPAVRQLSDQEQLDLFLSSLTQQIDFAIGSRANEKQSIGTGFAVAGTGHEALAAVKEALEQEDLPSQNFPAGTEISLFFFTRDFGRYVCLKDVRQTKEIVTICYRFVPHCVSEMITANLTRHFALIPLGKLPADDFNVNIVRSPMEKKYRQHHQPVSKEMEGKIVCNSFRFSISPADDKAGINE